MTLRKKDFGIWRILISLGPRAYLQPEGVFGIVAGAIISVVMVRYLDLEARIGLAGDFMVLASVLLGVVFATMALVVSLLSDEYLQVLCDSERGFLPFMAPFVAGMAVQLIAVISSLAYRVVAATWIHAGAWIFCFLVMAFGYAMMDVVSLAKTVIAHAVTRAEFTALSACSKKDNR